MLIKNQQKSARPTQTSLVAASNNAEIIDEHSRETTLYTGGNSTTPKPKDIKKALNFLENSNLDNNTSSNKKAPSRPMKTASEINLNDIIPLGEIENATNSMQNMVISMTPKMIPNSCRRPTVTTPKDMSLTIAATPNSKVVRSVKKNGNATLNNVNENSEKTTYNSLVMDQSNTTAADTPQTIVKTHRRRTVYNYRTMEVKAFTNITVLANSTIDKSNVIKSKTEENNNKTHDSSAANVNMPLKANELQGNKIEIDDAITKKKSPVKATPSRRRTLYTPKKINETKTNSRSTLFVANNNSSACASPPIQNFDPKTVISSTFLETTNKLTPKEVRASLIATPPADAQVGVLQEEVDRCVSPLLFSSTRKPGRRSTLFDVSMDIITQRLQCINQTARRSMVVPQAAAENNGACEDLGTIELETNVQQQTNCDNKSTIVETELVETMATAKKKRKLFMPAEPFLTPPSASSNANRASFSANKAMDIVQNGTPNLSATKRSRRSLMPLPQTPPVAAAQSAKAPLENKMLKNVICSTKNRRSTLDFEQIQSIKAKAATLSSDTKSPVAAKKCPVLVYTNMHKEQIDVIREVGTER